MKKLIVLFAFVLSSSAAFGQFEVKINPIGILFNSPDVGLEYLVSDRFGVEGRIGVSWSNSDFGTGEIKTRGFAFIGSGKYYFNPDMDCDKFYLGVYMKLANNSSSIDDDKSSNFRFALGPLFGYKWVSNSGKITFELNAGVGRAFVNKWSDDTADDFIDAVGLLGDIDFTGMLAVGYRFGN